MQSFMVTEQQPLTQHFLFLDLWDGVHLLLVQKDQDGPLLSTASHHYDMFNRQMEQWSAHT